MKLDCVLTATNDIPLYSDFIPIFVKTWKKLHPDVDIKIVYIAENLPEKYKEYEEHIVMFPPIEGLKTSFTAQYIRLLYPCLLEYENGVLITDMDMLPLSTTYYTDLSECSNNNFACFTKELTTKKGTHINQLPICYNIATPSIWSQVFNVKTMEDLKERLISYRKTAQRWCTDQSSLYTSVVKWNAETGDYIPLMKTGWGRVSFCRKGNVDYSLSNITKNGISEGRYRDFHCPRPYEKYKELIDEVYDLLPSAN